MEVFCLCFPWFFICPLPITYYRYPLLLFFVVDGWILRVRNPQNRNLNNLLGPYQREETVSMRPLRFNTIRSVLTSTEVTFLFKRTCSPLLTTILFSSPFPGIHSSLTWFWLSPQTRVCILSFTLGGAHHGLKKCAASPT